MKKIAKMLMVLVLCMTTLVDVQSEGKSNEISVTEEKINSILEKYHESIYQMSRDYDLQENELPEVYFVEIDRIAEKTVEELNGLGVEAYYINPVTYNEIERKMKTDFQLYGIEDNARHIAVIHGEDSACYASYGSSFDYIYNGTTYRLRYVTFTGADNSAYLKASTVNLMQSSSRTIIQNCLDTAINLYISSFSQFLGTVASICGLSVSMFGTTATSTLNLNCGTNWTRVYTQVWNSYDGYWENGSSVEYVQCRSKICGQYYSKTTNRFLDVPADESYCIRYSSHYYDLDWRKYNAVYYGHLNNWPQHDGVGSAKYYYGGTLKVTHSENF